MSIERAESICKCCAIPHVERAGSRRDFLVRAGGGFGAMALWSLLARDADARSRRGGVRNPVAAKPAPIPAKAKSVIWCFMDGGPSHLDLFDPKPMLAKLAGKPLPASFKRPITAMGKTAHTPLMASRRNFRRYGQSGIWVSDWYPEIAKCVDNMAMIQSVRANGLTHVASVGQMNTGSILAGRPSVGAWTLYGLGSECENLPGFVVMTDYPRDPPGGSHNWGTGFMPATYEGTRFRAGKTPILNIAPPEDYTPLEQRTELDYIEQLDRRHSSLRREDDSLEARIAAYELAYQMQSAAPEVVDLSDETQETRRLYGLDQADTADNARNCLIARRLVEHGVRFVQLYMGSGSLWDAHTGLEENHALHCCESDRPIAGLLRDLKRRGLLDSTLVIWGGEFGRTPMSESGTGRDHNPYGFSMWMAGGGVKPGTVYGATDEIGLYAIDHPAHIHDVHATILRLLGLNHETLTFQHNGRDERLTITSGKVIGEIIA
jgi:hypothetical protein